MEFNAITNAIIKAALDTSLVRHATISGNIANANTQGFVPMRVSFENQLATEKSALINRQVGPAELERLRTFQPRVEPGDGNVGGKVLLDMEMVNLSKNTLHYQALLKAMGKYTSIVNMAINEGR